MSDRSLLSVLVPARDGAEFVERLKAALAQLLLRLGVTAETVQSEIAAMGNVVLAPTNNRRVLGCMRDAEAALAYAIDSNRFATLEDLQWYLTDHIHSPTGYRYPGELATELLSANRA